MQCIIRMINYLLLYIAVYHPDDILRMMDSYLFLFTALTEEVEIEEISSKRVAITEGNESSEQQRDNFQVSFHPSEALPSPSLSFLRPFEVISEVL